MWSSTVVYPVALTRSHACSYSRSHPLAYHSGGLHWVPVDFLVRHQRLSDARYFWASAIKTIIRGFRTGIRASHELGCAPRLTKQCTTVIAPVIKNRLRRSGLAGNALDDNGGTVDDWMRTGPAAGATCWKSESCFLGSWLYSIDWPRWDKTFTYSMNRRILMFF